MLSKRAVENANYKWTLFLSQRAFICLSCVCIHSPSLITVWRREEKRPCHKAQGRENTCQPAEHDNTQRQQQILLEKSGKIWFPILFPCAVFPGHHYFLQSNIIILHIFPSSLLPPLFLLALFIVSRLVDSGNIIAEAGNLQ